MNNKMSTLFYRLGWLILNLIIVSVIIISTVLTVNKITRSVNVLVAAIPYVLLTAIQILVWFAGKRDGKTAACILQIVLSLIKAAFMIIPEVVMDLVLNGYIIADGAPFVLVITFIICTAVLCAGEISVSVLKIISNVKKAAQNQLT